MRILVCALLLVACGGSADAETARSLPEAKADGCYTFDAATYGLDCDATNPDLAAFVCRNPDEPGFECRWLAYTSVSGEIRSSYEPGNTEQMPADDSTVWRCCNITRPLQ